MKLHGGALALTTMALLASCATSSGVGTGLPASVGATCTESASHQVVESFIDDFNSGDIARLDQLFAGPSFLWYTTDAPGERTSNESTNRGDLMAYFTQRHHVHERLKLESYQFNGVAATGLGNFEFELTRSSDDGLAPTPYNGKGVIDCENIPNTLVLWGMNREPFLRARMLLYGALGGLLLAGVSAGAVIVFRRRRDKAKSDGARAIQG